MKQLLTKTFRNILVCIIFFLSFPITTPIILLLYIYKNIIMFIIRCRNSNVIELTHSDELFTHGESHHQIADILLVINSKTRNISSFISECKEMLKEKIFNCPEKFPKLTGTLMKFMGYSYIVPKAASLDDYVKVIKIEENDGMYKKTKREILEECMNDRQPLKNTLLWQVVFIDAPPSWKIKEELKENQHLLLIRLSHVIGDGMSLIHLCAHLFIGNIEDLKSSINFELPKKSHFMEILKFVYLFLIAPSYFLVKSLKYFTGAWNGPTVSHKRKIVFAAEKKKEMVGNIKSIKRKMKDSTTFTEVLLSAISSSLQKYFEKTYEVPECVLMAVVYDGITAKIEDFIEGDGPKLRNDCGFVLVDLLTSFKSSSMVERFRTIRMKTKNRLKSTELMVNYLMTTRICNLLPEKLYKFAVKMTKATTTLSNIAGIPRITLWNGDEIDNIFFFTPSSNQIGIGFTLITYDNRCHLGLAFDEAVISSNEVAQEILNDVSNSIKAMGYEINNNTVSNNDKDK